MTDSRRPRRKRPGRWLGACLLVSVLFAGCTSARSDLGTSDSACYLALPAATRSVGTGRLVGVHLATLKTVARESPRLARALESSGGSGARVCAFEFAGRFTDGSVSKPRGQESGHVAVVVLTSPGNRLLGTVILERSPFRFGHPHIG